MMFDQIPEFKPGRPIPDFVGIGEVIKRALPALSPPSRQSVADVATRRRVKAGGHWIDWRNDVAPYLLEPMKMITSRKYEAVCFVGPARSLKTQGLILNPIAHAVLANPRLVSVFHMTEASGREFSIEELAPVINNSPELAGRLMSGAGCDTIHEKRFSAGARVTVDWPVRSKLAARSIPLVLFTDYDAFPLNIAGEGDPFTLGRKRTQDAGSRAMTVLESSPRHFIKSEASDEKSRHEAPPCDGILSVYNQGSRARWYWSCEHCGEYFEASWACLKYPETGSPSERGAAAVAVCVHCGSIYNPADKIRLNSGGRWLHETKSGDIAPLGDDTRGGEIASYWLQGAAAALASWSQMVTRYCEAENKFKESKTDYALRTVYNVELGLPFLPRVDPDSDAVEITATELSEKKSEFSWQVAPRGTRFLTVAVDVQNGRFVVQVEAWRDDLERVLIDRYDIHTPPDSAPRFQSRVIDPGRYAEDWAALKPLAFRAYPVQGANHELRPVGIVIDAGGAAGVTPNAYAFYRRMMRELPKRFFLVRGTSAKTAPRAKMAFPKTAKKGVRYAAVDVPIIWAHSDKLKDEIAASLTKFDGGARALLISSGAPSQIFDEYAAERRDARGHWDKKPGVLRNEALDLSVYSLAFAIVFHVESIDFDSPPAWALDSAANIYAVKIKGAPDDPAQAVDPDKPVPGSEKPKVKKMAKKRRLRRVDDW